MLGKDRNSCRLIQAHSGSCTEEAALEALWSRNETGDLFLWSNSLETHLPIVATQEKKEFPFHVQIENFRGGRCGILTISVWINIFCFQKTRGHEGKRTWQRKTVATITAFSDYGFQHIPAIIGLRIPYGEAMSCIFKKLNKIRFKWNWIEKIKGYHRELLFHETLVSIVCVYACMHVCLD